jgi:hypothetical protein
MNYLSIGPHHHPWCLSFAMMNSNAMNDYVGGLENNTKLLVMREITFILEKLMLERETYKRKNGIILSKFC